MEIENCGVPMSTILYPADEAPAYRVTCAAVESIELRGQVDHTITDPPYDKRTQNGARSLTSRGPKAMAINFDAATDERRRCWASHIALVTRRFAAVFSDHESSMKWAEDLESFGMEYIRCGLWVRTGDEELTAQRPTHSGAPQMTGDGPAAGHEVIVFARAKGNGRIRWNGGGKAATYTAPVVRGAERVHETQKPVELLRDIIRDFCRPGDTVYDPFAGSGTTLVAAKQLGIQAFGVELAEKHAAYANRRVAAAGAL